MPTHNPHLLPMLDRFAPFGEPDLAALTAALQVAVPSMVPLPDAEPSDPTIVTLVTPDPQVAIVCALHLNPGAPATPHDCFPLVQRPGAIVLDVNEATGGTITGTVVSGDEPLLPVQFFNTHGLAEKAGEMIGQRWSAAIAGIAMRFQPFDPKPIAMPDEMMNQLGAPPDATLDTSQMTAWLPSPHFCDVIRFVGEIVATAPLCITLNGERASRVVVAVSREADEIALPFVVTETVARDMSVVPGLHIEGLAWLQGRLLGPAA